MSWHCAYFTRSFERVNTNHTYLVHGESAGTVKSTREPPQQNHTVYTNRYHSILEIIANGLLVPIMSDFHRRETNS
jgi:hypothetical protein